MVEEDDKVNGTWKARGKNKLSKIKMGAEVWLSSGDRSRQLERVYSLSTEDGSNC